MHACLFFTNAKGQFLVSLFDNARTVDVLLYLILLINKARLSKIP